MQFPERPDDKSSANRKDARASSFTLRLDRAAGDLNPFLIVLTIGLMLLDLTLYLGTTAARQPIVWRDAPHAAAAAPGTAQAGPQDYSR